MRIAYCTDQLLPQTATDTQQSLSMVAAFGAAGAEVTLVAPRAWGRRGPEPAELAAYYGVRPTFRVRALPSLYPGPRGLEKAGAALAAAMDEAARGADVMYSRNIPIVFAGLQMGRAPVAYETYRPWPRRRPVLGPLFRVFGENPRWLGAVLHSRLAAESYAGAGVPPEKLLVAHNGYDPAQLEPRLEPDEARMRLGLPLGGPIACYAGHIAPEKGLGLLLDLAERLPEVTFLLVGSKGPGPVEARAARLPNVRVVGWGSFAATVPYLYAADVLLIPPTRGPLERVGNTVLPIKTFLYMATGRAIFAPSTPDLLEVLAHGRNACLVPPDDPAAALAALRGLVADAALRARLGAAAAADAERRTWDNRARAILAFLETRLRA